jgi:phosphoenolpyruvate synthase/pyruvate phosphate dikinase
MDEHPYVSSLMVWLGDAASYDPKIVGPKAAHLSQLAARFQVPPGFCLSADMYRQAGPSGLLSADLRSEVASAYAQLADQSGMQDPPVAVRSSAVDEDGPLASFAGQHETLLNIVGIAALVEAIEHSWASARTQQALAYRELHGLAVEDIGLAVLVQQLVRSDVSGVMFSANPVNGRRDELIVSSSWGLGESIVGGTVTPDSWVLRKLSHEVVEERLGDKRQMTVVTGDGTREVDVPRFLRSQPSLSEEQVLEVSRLGERLESLKGWPVDIEFAYAGGMLYLLQCRPITTLPTESAILTHTG